MNETPCPRTTVGRSSAAYCMPMLKEKLTKNLPKIITIVVARPVGMNEAMILHIPLKNIVPKPSQRLPHLSSTSVTKLEAGNSVAAPKLNPRKGLNPIESMFRTYPSNNSDMVMYIMINKMVFFRSREVLKRSRIEYFLTESSSC